MFNTSLCRAAAIRPLHGTERRWQELLPKLAMTRFVWLRCLFRKLGSVNGASPMAAARPRWMYFQLQLVPLQAAWIKLERWSFWSLNIAALTVVDIPPAKISYPQRFLRESSTASCIYIYICVYSLESSKLLQIMLRAPWPCSTAYRESFTNAIRLIDAMSRTRPSAAL